MSSPTDATAQAIRQSVLTLLNALDPYGLLPGDPGGAPPDEYSLEANPIAAVLMREGCIELQPVDAIWLEWFDQKLSDVVTSDAVDALVDDLNRLTAG